MPWSTSVISTPSSMPKKSKCHHDRRNSPSVATFSPTSSCFFMIFSISRSSTSASCAALIAPFSRFARASFNGAVRNRLPTMSARNGGLLLVMGDPPQRLAPAIWRAGLQKEAGTVRCRQLKSAKLEDGGRRLMGRFPTGTSGLNGDAAFDDRHRIGSHRHHARRRYHFAGADIELAIVEITFDHVALDIALRQRAGPMRAQVVGDEEFAVDVEHRQRQIIDLDLERGAGYDLARGAEIKTFCC